LDIQTPEKILIYHVGNIGDIIVATPVYRSIRKTFPEAKITLLTSPGRRGLPGAKEIIAPLNLVDDIKVYYPEEINSVKKLIKFFIDIKKGDYDFLIYLPANQWEFWHILRDMIFFRLGGIRYAIGFEIYEGYYFYKKNQKMPKNEVDRLMKILEPLGPTFREEELEFPVMSEDRHFASDLFNKYNIKGEQLKIIVHPGGKKPSKLWPKEKFAQLVDRLIEEIGVQVILVGSVDEVKMTNEIIELMQHGVVNLTGKLTLSQLAAVIDRADLTISNDSGPMHIAAALKIPVVVLFSSVDIPNLWYPYGDIHTVIRKDVDCSPCFKERCSEHYCMNEIHVEEVYRAVKRTLGREETIS
jgi:lipopolysaccharide heptosyltransferase II